MKSKDRNLFYLVTIRLITKSLLVQLKTHYGRSLGKIIKQKTKATYI